MINRTEYYNNYKRDKLKRVPLELTKEKYEEVKKFVQEHNEKSINGFIKKAIDEKMERDKSK